MNLHGQLSIQCPHIGAPFHDRISFVEKYLLSSAERTELQAALPRYRKFWKNEKRGSHSSARKNTFANRGLQAWNHDLKREGIGLPSCSPTRQQATRTLDTQIHLSTRRCWRMTSSGFGPTPVFRFGITEQVDFTLLSLMDVMAKASLELPIKKAPRGKSEGYFRYQIRDQRRSPIRRRSIRNRLMKSRYRVRAPRSAPRRMAVASSRGALAPN